MTKEVAAAASIPTELPSIEPLQLLDPAGKLTALDELPIDLGEKDLLDLYRLMVITRRVDRESINLQRQGQLGVYASCLGQEAAQVGSAYALGEDDWVFPTYREHGVAIVRGVDPAQLLHVWRGTWHGMHDVYETRFALQAIPIATQALHAVGYAMGARLDKKPIVTIAYFGEGATSEGDLHEAMNFSSVYDAPTVFFCQNNGYAISLPFARQARGPTLAHRAIGYDMPGIRVDGNDVLASYAATMKAVERARSGQGPTFIEAITYRLEGHSTSDDPMRYRAKEDLEEWAERDPLTRLELYLKETGIWDDGFAEQIEEDARERTTRLRDSIYDAGHPNPLELFDHVYINEPPQFERQRAQMRAEIEARGGEDA
ncbi:MAG: pyruvate dehydrogenase (acetyl-transferring) E1 component subunit alpha [Actinomycetota bacterium]